jgi:hypothetical protein
MFNCEMFAIFVIKSLDPDPHWPKMLDPIPHGNQCRSIILLFSMDTPFANPQAALSSLGGTCMVLAYAIILIHTVSHSYSSGGN